MNAEAETEDDARDEATAAPETVGPPKRRRGRPKGTPKTGGRPAKPRTATELRSHIITELNKAEHLIQIARGEEMRLSGPTGKPMLGRPTVDQQLKAWELLLKKALPDLTAQTLDAKVEGHIEAPAFSTRETARAVMDILRTARIEDAAELPVIDGKQFNGVANERAAGHGAAGDADGTPAAAGPGFNAVAAAAAAEYDRQMKANRQANGKAAPGDLPESWQRQPVPLFDPDNPGNTDPQVPTGGFQPGERIMIKDEHGREVRGWLEFAYRANDAREAFWVVNKDGDRVRSVLGRAEAEAALRQLASTGKIST